MENQKLKKIGDRCFPCPGDALSIGCTYRNVIRCKKIKNVYGLGIPLKLVAKDLKSKDLKSKQLKMRALVHSMCPYVEK